MVAKYIHVTVVLAFVSLFAIDQGILPTSSQAAGSDGTFTGTWVANGSKDALPFGENRETALFKLSGHVSLKVDLGMQKDYWSECIGLADTELGSNIRCVWRALNGEKIYLVLQSKFLAQGASVSGTIVGGSGSVTGITGSLNFQWTTMSFQKQNNAVSIGGYATNLNGTFRLP